MTVDFRFHFVETIEFCEPSKTVSLEEFVVAEQSGCTFHRRQ
jgi:hypothetical protein